MNLQGNTFFFPWEVSLMEWLQANLGESFLKVISYLSLFGELQDTNSRDGFAAGCDIEDRILRDTRGSVFLHGILAVQVDDRVIGRDHHRTGANVAAIGLQNRLIFLVCRGPGCFPGIDLDLFP